MSQRHPTQNNVIMLVTTVTKNREPVFKDPALAREAIDTLYRVQEHHPFFLFGFVIMPDHIHLLLQVMEPETISGIMNVYKSGVVFNLGKSQLWQPRFHMKIINNMTEALRYIHENPTRKGLSESAEMYPWSSASGKWDVTSMNV